MGRRNLLIAVAGLYVAFLVGVWNTVTAGLATNGWFLAGITLPGFFVVPWLAKSAEEVESAEQARVAFRNAGGSELSEGWSVVIGLAAVFAGVVFLGAAIGLAAGSYADRWRTDIYLSGISHPGRITVVAGVILGVVAVALLLIDVDEAGWGLLAAVIIVVLGVAVGVRSVTGVFPEAREIAAHVSNGGRPTAAGVGALAAAIARDRAPEPEFLDDVPDEHAAGVTIAEVVASPDEWSSTVVTLEGTIGAVEQLRERNRRGQAMEAWTLTGSDGTSIGVVVWRSRGDAVPAQESACAGRVSITGQVLATPDGEEGGERVAVLGHRWSCGVRPAARQIEVDGTFEVARLRQFDRIIAPEVLLEVGTAYRSIPSLPATIVLESSVTWNSGVSGSVVIAAPVEGVDADEVCAAIVVYRGEPTCDVVTMTWDAEMVTVLSAP